MVIVGMSVGETKEINVTFPEDYPVRIWHLNRDFYVTVKDLKRTGITRFR